MLLLIKRIGALIHLRWRAVVSTGDRFTGGGADFYSKSVGRSWAGTDCLLTPSIGSQGRQLSLTPEIVPSADLVGTEVAGRTRDQAATNAYIQAQIGWAAGGWMMASLGAAIGAGLGCIGIPVLGCIPGAMIGTIVGGYMGIAAVNPNFQPAVDEFLDTF